jgi:hypothetical protein
VCSTLCLVRKLVCRRTIFGSAANPAHATAAPMHFPANAGLIFLTDELTYDRYLVDTGATLIIVPCNQNSSPSGPFLIGADGQPIPSWGFIQKNLQFQGKLFTPSFLQAAVASPILGKTFLENSRSLLPQRSTKHSLLALQRPRLPPICFQRPCPPHHVCLALHRL